MSLGRGAKEIGVLCVCGGVCVVCGCVYIQDIAHMSELEDNLQESILFLSYESWG